MAAFDRRKFLQRAGLSAAAATAVPAGLTALAPAALGAATSHCEGLRDEGVGVYTDMSVAFQLSYFTINRQMVSCGVGPISIAGGSGPFSMLMYSTIILRYLADHHHHTLRVTGRMRSITRMAGATVEDINHHFLAVAFDGGGHDPDRFDVHLVTPFWGPTNPMATPSTERPGWVRFGGALVLDDHDVPMGSISVGDPHDEHHDDH